MPAWVCVKGKRDDIGPGGTETSSADSTPFSFYYQIIHDKQLWRLPKVREAGGKKLWWEQRRFPQFCKHSIMNATCLWHLKCHLYMMQSSMCHFQMTVMALTFGWLPPSQYKRLAAVMRCHLSNCKKKTLADNTINTDCMKTKSTIIIKKKNQNNI